MNTPNPVNGWATPRWIDAKAAAIVATVTIGKVAALRINIRSLPS